MAATLQSQNGGLQDSLAELQRGKVALEVHVHTLQGQLADSQREKQQLVGSVEEAQKDLADSQHAHALVHQKLVALQLSEDKYSGQLETSVAALQLAKQRAEQELEREQDRSRTEAGRCESILQEMETRMQVGCAGGDRR